MLQPLEGSVYIPNFNNSVTLLIMVLTLRRQREPPASCTMDVLQPRLYQTQ